MKEIWKPIKNYNGIYEISNKGRVRSVDRHVIDIRNGKKRTRLVKGKLRKINFNKKNKYAQIILQNGGYKMYYIHRLVAEAFCERRRGQNWVFHLSKNILDNKSINLKWGTRNEAVEHFYELYPEQRKYVSITRQEVEQVIKLTNDGYSHKQLINAGISQHLIKAIREKAVYPELLKDFKFNKAGCPIKLSRKDVLQIKSMIENGIKCAEISTRFNVHVRYIQQIKSGKKFAEITGGKISKGYPVDVLLTIAKAERLKYDGGVTYSFMQKKINPTFITKKYYIKKTNKTHCMDKIENMKKDIDIKDAFGELIST